MPGTHDLGREILSQRTGVASSRGRFVLRSARTNQGRPAMNLALKWDVLAVGVVLLFVGAVLLGAF